MSVWQTTQSAPHLFTTQGELISVSVYLNPRDLESALDALAQMSFPVNPQIIHSDGRSHTVVCFPAYSSELAEIYEALEAYHFHRDQVRVAGALQAGYA